METNRDQPQDTHKVLIGSLIGDYGSNEPFIGIVFARNVSHRDSLDDIVGLYSLRDENEDLPILKSDEPDGLLRPMSLERRYLEPSTTADMLRYADRVTNIELCPNITQDELVKKVSRMAVDQLLSRFELYHG